MNQSLLIIFAMSVIAATAGLTVFEVFSKYFAPQVKPARPTNAADVPPRFSKIPALLRLLADKAGSLMPATRRQTAEADSKLDRAGIKMEADTWRGFVILSFIICAFALLGAVSAFLTSDFWVCLLAFTIGGFIGWGITQWYLIHKEKERRHLIEAQLPDTMEFLSIAVAAGSPVEQCFRSVATNIDAPLSEEFARVDAMVHVGGKTRDDALRAMASRCGSMEVSSFTAAVIQAVNQGASVSENLSERASIARKEKHGRVMERIKKMSTKLSVVLSFCYLPPIIAIVLLPIVVNLLAFANDTM